MRGRRITKGDGLSQIYIRKGLPRTAHGILCSLDFVDHGSSLKAGSSEICQDGSYAVICSHRECGLRGISLAYDWCHDVYAIKRRKKKRR